MKKNTFMLLVVGCIALLPSCTNDCLDEMNKSEISRVKFLVQDFEWATENRGKECIHKTKAVDNEGAISFVWCPNDTVGIYPQSGSQVEFPIYEGDGTSVASFDGGGWALKNDYSYIAYYPYNKHNYDRSNILLPFGGQKQVGNNNYDNLTKCDYVVSQVANTTNGELTFVFKHLAALVKFQFTVPEADTFSGLLLSSEESIFPILQCADLTGETPEINTVSTSKYFQVLLSNVSVAKGEVVTIYALVPASDLSKKTFTAKLISSKASYITTMEGKNFQSGKGYSYSSSLTKSSKTHLFVDLGLSVNWAMTNIGANSPEDYGDYFAWAETTPQSEGHYKWSTYKWCNGNYDVLTKYCNTERYGYNDFKDFKTIIENSDDAATSNWGLPWRLPIKEEQDELRLHCSWSWKTINGISGYEVKSVNGNYIFLPAAGSINADEIQKQGTGGRYWSSTIYEGYVVGAFGLYFNSEMSEWSVSGRNAGLSIRPVFP